MITEEIRRLAIRKAGGSEIREQALSEGMRTVRDDGAYKILCGISTVDEVLRVTAEDGS
jgi:type II secretory ATPase GspE/PulE/Tfp pilus assembly ATPase PilB-like protein